VLALPTEAVARRDVAAEDRIARGPSFDAADLVTGDDDGLARPRFDASAGFSAAGGIQPAEAMPQSLSGGYAVLPSARDAWSSSVTDAGSDGSLTVTGGNASATVIAISPSSTVSGPGLSAGLWGSGASRSGSAGAVARVLANRHLEALTQTSVFVSKAPDGGFPAVAASGSLATLQGPGSLTVDRAVRGAGTAPDPAGGTIEAYAVADPGTSGPGTAASLTLPMQINSISYGFLNSSLTVFSDEFGGIGQSFNGLAALNIAEPATGGVVAAGLIGLVAIRRRRRGR
jgi:hypothetical protein